MRFAFRLLRWAIWFGVLTGYLELLNLGLKKYVLGRLLLLGCHTLWLAPLADAALFLALGAMLVPFGVCWPTRLVQRLAIFAFGFTLAASLVLLHREIHNYAAAMLSAGVGVQMARLISARVESFDGLVRRTLPWMLAVCMGSAVALPAWWTWAESRAIGALPRVSEACPNVLLIVWDTVRSESLSTYGYDRDTSPNLTRLGEDGIVFERAVAPSPWTLPSHASLFTGRWAHELSATSCLPLDDTYPTLAEVLSAEGYATAGFVANQCYCSRWHGFHRGFLHYEDFNVLGTEFVLSCQMGRRLVTSQRLRRWTGWQDVWGRKSAERINHDFLRWVDRRRNRPFFAFLNYYDAHEPYHAPPPFDERFGTTRSRKDVPFEAHLRRTAPLAVYPLTPRQRVAEQNAYDGSIAYLDACLGRLLGELETRGILDDTLLIVTSDHGEHFGEHGLRQHGNSLYRPLLHVPLVIRCPKGAPAGLRPSHVVSLCDLPATVTDLLGCADRFEFPGSSLRRRWDGTEREGSRATVVYACLRPSAESPDPGQHLDAVIAEGLHYIKFGGGGEALFDFLNDPSEAHDLSSAENMQETLSKLRALAARCSREPGTDFARASGEAGNSSVLAVRPALSARTAAESGALVVSVVLALLVTQLVHLYWVVAWGDHRTKGLNYYGRPLAERCRFKKVLYYHRVALSPMIWLLSRVSRFTFSKVTFSYRGVAGPKGTCSVESFRQAAEYEPRRGDVFVATQMRCGTTWMQHVVYQVLTRGSGDLAEAGTALYAVSPWIESSRSVSIDDAPLVGTPRTSRIIKAHLPVRLCPYSPEAKYIYVCRHPLSCFASCADFVAANLGPFVVHLNEIEAWFRSDELMWWGTWPSHVRGWWGWSRQRDNVLFILFEDMRRDLRATVRQVADFLQIERLREEEVEEIVRKCSFDYMREHDYAFEMNPPHVLQSRASFFFSGQDDRYGDVPQATRQRILAWCKSEMAGSDFPLERCYPDVAEAT